MKYDDRFVAMARESAQFIDIDEREKLISEMPLYFAKHGLSENIDENLYCYVRSKFEDIGLTFPVCFIVITTILCIIYYSNSISSGEDRFISFLIAVSSAIALNFAMLITINTAKKQNALKLLKYLDYMLASSRGDGGQPKEKHVFDVPPQG